jgi:hypothetical protein
MSQPMRRKRRCWARAASGQAAVPLKSSDEFAPSKANAHLALRGSQSIKPEIARQSAIGDREPIEGP